ncbi:type I secretion protein [Mesorhizobium sp. BAC0120]|uniref:type I secretion protein n=1 Tax=Mesorhizobium sp. BAC0120 TaxID=3090670 RepID=UPI00298BD6C1|nr:type I secretion protein [Mesorhizobium sp. BAC0120]MDW6026336.1 type I secretion protein [Mesorhizobium sp. BAC0120]
MLLDKLTQTIAHFIGLFETTLEEARLRGEYNEFTAHQEPRKDPADLPHKPVELKAVYELVDFKPNVPYLPAEPDLVGLQSAPYVGLQPPVVPDIPQQISTHAIALPHMPAMHVLGSAHAVQPLITPPGSVAVFINQGIQLSDDDNVSVGNHGLTFHPTTDVVTPLDELMTAAMRLSPIADTGVPGSDDEIVSFIKNVPKEFASFDEPVDNAKISVIQGDALEESPIVNGKPADQAPKLDDHLPKQQVGADDGLQSTPISNHDASGEFAKGGGHFSVTASLDLHTGQNTLVNNAGIVNDWLEPRVTAVVGDHVELNAIIQINAMSDVDAIGQSVNGWSLGASKPSEAFNIAMFKRLDPSAGHAASKDTAHDFPKAWAVTEIKGDLLIMNWLNQFSFMSDNDVSILSASGNKTSVITGENTSFNDTFLNELGRNYDLVVVGGNIYDANIIKQMNVLLDDDLVGAVKGFETTGEASLSTHGNLLWNQASILNVGGANRFEALPQSYVDAAEHLKNGNKHASADVLHDQAFAGLAGLRVLYISGDMVNLQYMSQTNVLGDSDQVAVAMDALAPHPEANWTISTGSNALVNFASILDVDALGKTYVGGDHYSDELLVQADFISTRPDLGGHNPDILVNEAVAFLDDDMLHPGNAHNQHPSGHSNHAPASDAMHADPMHSMLA